MKDRQEWKVGLLISCLRNQATPDKPMRSGDISKCLLMPDAYDEGPYNSFPVTRDLIKYAIKKGYGIASTSKGYFLIETEEQREAYISKLQGYILGVQDRINNIKSLTIGVTTTGV